MILKQVPEGQRKLIATIITMIVGIAAEKYMGGLSDNLTILIGGALALFVGGNAMEYVAQIKAGKSGMVNLPPPQQEVVEMDQEATPDIEAIRTHITQLDQICGQVFAKYDKQFDDMNKLLIKQNNSIDGMLQVINKRGNSET